ncbi:MAG: rhodanese-like domain-containing protein [Desulfobacterales bacterium]|jgi:rhodanese-related sulfurtransferase/rubrerythrin
MISLKKLFTPVKSIDTEEAKTFMAEHKAGAYTLLDVRQPKEYEDEHIPGARLIPLPGLKEGLSELDKDKPVIAYCAVGGRSIAAAQLLSGLGFKEIYNLKGGIKAWQGGKAAGPRELNLELVHGDEKPAEMIALAYAMEMGLGIVYRKMAERSDDPEIQSLLTKLADIENQHKKRLLEILAEIDSPIADTDAYEAEIRPSILEGGFGLADFMQENESFFGSVQGILDLAMMLETQALDLYLRFAEKTTDERTQQVLFSIADEEKAHLSSLGDLMDEKI